MENNTNIKEFSPEASLKIIYEMIEATKSEIGKNYFYYLFWGYLVAITSILEYFLIAAVEYSKHYLVWPVLMTAGTIVTLVFYIRTHKASLSKTFIGTTMGYLWAGWFISFCILILFIILKGDHGLILPVIMAMYGLAIFVAGGIVSFKPLLIGAIVAWIGAIASFFTPYTAQLMILAGVVIVSHIIPGHILRNKSKI
jgi:hypothetical protein